MYIYQYVLLAGFVCLLLTPQARVAATCFLLGWLVYLVFIIDIDTSYKYISCGTIEVAISYYLNSMYRVVAYLGYSLLLVNIYGLLLFKNGVGPMSYDLIYAIISVTQFLFLLARALPNGLTRLPAEHPLVRAVNFDSRGAYAIMHKNPTKKGSNR